MHVTLRVVPEVGRLRRRKAFRAVRRATQCSAVWSRTRGIFRICHVSVQGNHIHMIVEAQDRETLSRGMQGFAISCAKQLNAEIVDADGNRRRGKVFADRFHARVLRTPLEVRRALVYVLNNWRRHGEAASLPDHVIDPFATGRHFPWWDGWLPPQSPYPETKLLNIWMPMTWLLDKGWQRHGLIAVDEVPGPHARRRRGDDPAN